MNQATGNPVGMKPASPPIKVLTVDDLQEKLLVYRSILEEPGLEVICARSGPEALRLVLQHDFAVILLDVNMPDMDGYEAAGLMRSRKRSSHTPIIFVTAYADEMQTLRGYSLGAVDYILAPVAPDVLRTKVRVFVELYRKTLEVQRQAETLRDLQNRAHQRELWETNERLRLALDAGRMGACEWDLKTRLLSWSPTLEAIFGFNDGEFDGAVERLSSRLHPEDREYVLESLSHAVARRGELQLEHRILRRGKVAWIELRGKVFTDEKDQPARLAGVCLDITERKQAETELAEHRARLEELVQQRTAELQASHERLRLADRLASIGTLAAGLGHDMGNLLLPIRARLASLERMNLPKEAMEDIRAIETAGEYLKRLSKGLRLFALDPAESASGEATRLHEWWPDVEPFLRNSLPKSVMLESDFPATLPPLAMPPHAFTQVIYNLVQNAGDVMSSQPSGNVRLTASAAPLAGVVISVSDNGPGMTDEVRQRCMEPFFTTRPRRISTGLGLALVRGAVGNARGTIDIESALGRGTTFRITLPVAASADVADPTMLRLGTACVSLADPRMSAYVASLLRALRLEVQRCPWKSATGARLLVIDSVNGSWGDLVEFLDADATRRVVVFGKAEGDRRHQQLSWLEDGPSPARIREVLQDAIRAEREAIQNARLEVSA